MTQPVNPIALIKTAVEISVTRARQDAALDGSWGDGGAGVTERNLEYWLDGVNFARTGVTKKYRHILEEAARQNDPDYKQYLDLKARFG